MSDIFHDAYVSVVTEKERLKTQLSALAAENERLRKPWVKILTESENWKALSEIAQLRAENERLRKAGDAMADTRNKPTTLSEFGHLAMAWFAAKEGRDAK